jgi:2-polyprenyl-6-hydroxyphenyl methylase/3-demethylubiquinone-9 3-methyltransferase
MFSSSKKFQRIFLSTNRKKFSMFIDEKDRVFFTKIKDWWDPKGSMRTLHYYNDLRVQYIQDKLREIGRIPQGLIKPLTGLQFLDIGCGAGLLCEV